MFMIAILLPVPLYYRVDSLGLLVPMACLTPYFAPPPPPPPPPQFCTKNSANLPQKK